MKFEPGQKLLENEHGAAVVRKVEGVICWVDWLEGGKASEINMALLVDGWTNPLPHEERPLGEVLAEQLWAGIERAIRKRNVPKPDAEVHAK